MYNILQYTKGVCELKEITRNIITSLQKINSVPRTISDADVRTCTIRYESIIGERTLLGFRFMMSWSTGSTPRLGVVWSVGGRLDNIINIAVVNKTY